MDEPPTTPAVLEAPAPLDPQGLLTAAIKEHVPIEVMERLIALRERLKADAAREAFRVAMAAFQGECPRITKSKRITIRPSSGAAYAYAYAPLDEMKEQLAPLLQKHGFSYSFKPTQDERSVTVTCEVHHVAGHTEAHAVTVPLDAAARMNEPQKVGSAITYASRYSFAAGFGLSPGEDNDAATAGADTPAVTFDPPKRASAAPAAAPSPPPSPSPSVLPFGTAGGDDPVPSDAISRARMTRLFALVHEAIRAQDVPEDQGEAVFERAHDYLTLWVQQETKRPRLSHCSWRDYDALCAQVAGAVAAALRGPAPKARWVATRRPGGRR